MTFFLLKFKKLAILTSFNPSKYLPLPSSTCSSFDIFIYLECFITSLNSSRHSPPSHHATAYYHFFSSFLYFRAILIHRIYNKACFTYYLLMFIIYLACEYTFGPARHEWKSVWIIGEVFCIILWWVGKFEMFLKEILLDLRNFQLFFEDQKLKNNRKTKSQRKSHKDQKPLQFLHTKSTKSSYFMLTSSCTSWCLSPQHCVT